MDFDEGDDIILQLLLSFSATNPLVFLPKLRGRLVLILVWQKVSGKSFYHNIISAKLKLQDGPP